MTRLYAVAKTEKSPNQHAREAVKRYRKKPLIGYARLREATIREGAGMRWLPAWYSAWWKAPVVRPEKGEIERRLGYKS